MTNTKLIPDDCLGEEYAQDVAFVLKPSKVLGEVTSKYQTSKIVQTETYGRVVFQDDLVYLADRGNEALGEMYTHIPMLSGPVKKKVLLIGAGDGAGVERFLKYPTLEKIVAIDIDKDFVDLTRRVMSDKTKSFDDPRVELKFVDGAEYLHSTEDVFDAIVCTVGDPFTISNTLFTKQFVQDCAKHLSEGGVLSMDGYMPYYTHEETLNYWDIFNLVSDEFPITRVAMSTSPIMPGGLCTFIFGSKKTDTILEPRHDLPCQTVWYNYNLHKASFFLPEFVIEKLKSNPKFSQ